MDTNEFLTVLVTGGAGYIGSHCVIELLDHGFQVVIVDNCEYAGDQPKCLDEIKKLTGKECAFYNVDIRNHSQLVPVFENHNIFCIIHCAALKSVAQSVMEPLSYYDTNVCGTVALLKVASLFSVKRVIFSSSCSVYGSPGALPVLESNPIGATIESPYGRTKYVAEMVLKDLHESDTKWNVVILRYFNTVGCHHSRKIGEQPRGKPQNLMPLIAEVALGNAPFLNVYGADYGTPDGTAIRDYIHVVDLAKGHVAAVNQLMGNCGFKIYNLSTGKGLSVLDMVRAFEKASGKTITIVKCPRRPGDPPSVYGDGTLAERELNWKCVKDVRDMCEDAWHWHFQLHCNLEKS